MATVLGEPCYVPMRPLSPTGANRREQVQRFARFGHCHVESKGEAELRFTWSQPRITTWSAERLWSPRSILARPADPSGALDVFLIIVIRWCTAKRERV